MVSIRIFHAIPCLIKGKHLCKYILIGLSKNLDKQNLDQLTYTSGHSFYGINAILSHDTSSHQGKYLCHLLYNPSIHGEVTSHRTIIILSLDFKVDHTF